MFGKPMKIPGANEALPGRDEKMLFDPIHQVHGRSMVEPFPSNMERVILGFGCFWGAERKFWNLEGVYTTAVGYAAGHTQNPTYQEVCTGMTGHNEVVLVVYDPALVSFQSLLKVFWESHDPTQGMQQGTDRGDAISFGNLLHQRRTDRTGKIKPGKLSTALRRGRSFDYYYRN